MTEKINTRDGHLAWLIVLCAMSCHGMEQAAVGELFTYKIEPMLFNWSHHVANEQFHYRPSLAGYPDLPSWMRYMYSEEHHAGFLYGTPPDRLAGQALRLDIAALNKQNYDMRVAVLAVFVAHKFPTPNVIQMKIDNLNWVHLMDPGRVENLRNIFRMVLWPESENDLSLIFMESSVNMGGRLPLRPQQREGVIVHLGSFAQFSARLKELREEVRPLYKLPSCTYKRTSVQKLFENAGFKLDWCAFRMVGAEISPEILFHNHDVKGHHPSDLSVSRRSDRWHSILRDEAPSRNYIDEFAFAFAIPGMIFAVFLGILSAVLCFQHKKLYDPQSEFFFENIFSICEYECKRECNEADHDKNNDDTSIDAYPTSSTVQMVQCSDTNQAVTTLRSLKDPNCLPDNISLRSQSSTAAESPSKCYLRPNPPPYNSGSLGKISVDI